MHTSFLFSTQVTQAKTTSSFTRSSVWHWILVAVISWAPLSVWAQPIQFGVLPSGSLASLEPRLNDMVAELETMLKRPVQRKTRGSFRSYLQALQEHQFDFALIQPFDYITLRRQGVDYLPLIRVSDEVKAIFVVKDMQYASLQALKDQKIGFPPYSAAATILAVEELKRINGTVDTDNFVYFSEHRSCIQAVLISSVKACATVSQILDQVIGKNISNMHIIHETPGIPSLLIIGRAKYLDSDMDVKHTLVEWGKRPENAIVLPNGEKLFFTDTNDDEYDPVEAIYDSYYNNEKNVNQNNSNQKNGNQENRDQNQSDRENSAHEDSDPEKNDQEYTPQE